jgi:glycosyltransferase involved in cell wall biosynthesis
MIGPAKTLTIGIPTYSRKEIIASVMSELIEFVDINSDFEILVIDNASSDGTFETLIEMCNKKSDVRILKNEENLGFGGNFNRLIQEAEGQYILLVSDEDELVKENIAELIEYLKEHQPAFLSAQFIRDVGYGEFVYMGRGRVKKIKPTEFHSSSYYISGLIYDVSKSRNFIDNITRIQLENVSAFVYAHTLLSALLLITYDNSYWYNQPIVKQKYNQEPESVMSDDSKYNSVQNRWNQYHGFIDYFSNFRNNVSTNREKRMIDTLIKSHQKKLFYWLRWGISTSNPSYLTYFDRGATLFVIDQLKFQLRMCLNFIFRHSLYRRETNTSVPTQATWRLTRKK